jgi:hypothetical protein
LEAFGASHPGLLEKAMAGTGYFSRLGWSITVVVEDLSVRVPKSFDVFPVVKGRLDRSSGEVKWLAR